MSISFKSKLNVAFGVAISFLLVVSYISYETTRTLLDDARWTMHTHKVIEAVESFESLVKDMETGQRGYLLTGDDIYLVIFGRSLGASREKLSELNSLVVDNEQQQRRLVEAGRFLEEKIEEMQRAIKIRDQEGFAAALKWVNAGLGKKIMDSFRAVIKEIKADENQLLVIRRRSTEDKGGETLTVVSTGAMLAIFIIAAAVYVMNRAEGDRQKKEAEIALNGKINSCLNLLYDRMRSDQSNENLGQSIIDSLIKSLDVPLGMLHLANLDQTMVTRAAGHAIVEPVDMPKSFAWGEGIVGQAAKQQQVSHISQVPENYFLVASGLGRLMPKELYVIPVVFGKRTLGVIEIATFRKLNEFQQGLLDVVMEPVALTLISAQNRSQTADLLAETQAQSEKLLVQQEELRQTNEELMQQGETLKESEEELQSQAEELRKANEELAAQTRLLVQKNEEVAAKNEALERNQQALRDAVGSANEANKAKSTFLANMSHELRTPLNSILILSELLQKNADSTLTPKQIEFAASIRQSGVDLLTLIDDILDLSKIEAGKIELHGEDLALSDLAESMEHYFKHMAAKKGLTFTVELASDLPRQIFSDKQRLEQILKNFLSNAFKFTTQGFVTIKVSRVVSDAGQNQILFTVADSGCGIPRAKQQLIFEAFRQADSTISRKYGGSGLGLSIAKELARLLGGTIQFESEENQGSVFKLLLPEKMPARVVSSPARAQRPSRLVESDTVAVSSAAPQVAGQNVVIIEDDDDFALLLTQTVAARGFKGLVASTAKEGMELIKAKMPKAILLDLCLPDMDGIEVLRMINKDEQASRIPVQVITGSGRETEAMEAGATGYSPKPTSVARLDQFLRQIQAFHANPAKKVLLVRGDSVMEGLLAQLRKCNLDTTVVETGDQALEVMPEGRFDVLLIDGKRRDMGAFELLKKMDAQAPAAQPPTIVYSDNLLPPGEANALKRYVKSVVVKGSKARERLLDEIQFCLYSLGKATNRSLSSPSTLPLSLKRDLLQGKKIMLVDDDSRNIFALLNVLEAEGVDVLIARNGRECLELLEQDHSVQLILMDIMMPEMDGYEATRRIRKDSRFAHLPIIALTAKAMPEDRAKCLEAGVTDYLSKPLEIDKVLSLIAVWLESEKHARRGAS